MSEHRSRPGNVVVEVVEGVYGDEEGGEERRNGKGELRERGERGREDLQKVEWGEVEERMGVEGNVEKMKKKKTRRE
jgi:hypothetical protein